MMEFVHPCVMNVLLAGGWTSTVIEVSRVKPPGDVTPVVGIEMFADVEIIVMDPTEIDLKFVVGVLGVMDVLDGACTETIIGDVSTGEAAAMTALEFALLALLEDPMPFPRAAFTC